MGVNPELATGYSLNAIENRETGQKYKSKLKFIHRFDSIVYDDKVATGIALTNLHFSATRSALLFRAIT